MRVTIKPNDNCLYITGELGEHLLNFKVPPSTTIIFQEVTLNGDKINLLPITNNFLKEATISTENNDLSTMYIVNPNLVEMDINVQNSNVLPEQITLFDSDPIQEDDSECLGNDSFFGKCCYYISFACC